jgi:hypothetical protein
VRVELPVSVERMETVVDTDDDPEEDANEVVEAVNNVLPLVDNEADPVCDGDTLAVPLVQALADDEAAALIVDDIVLVLLVDTVAEWLADVLPDDEID